MAYLESLDGQDDRAHDEVDGKESEAAVEREDRSFVSSESNRIERHQRKSLHERNYVQELLSSGSVPESENELQRTTRRIRVVLECRSGRTWSLPAA